MDPTDDKMEPVDTHHLAESYVADFVLDHLEQVAVKKEGGGMERLPASMLQCGGGVVMSQTPPPPPPSHLLTPPGHHSGDEYGIVASHPSMVMHPSSLMYPDTPGTPPDTPPESNSPHSPPGRHYQMEPQIISQYQRIAPGVQDEVAWIMSNNGLRQEPLDLRPNGANEMGIEEWTHLQQSHPQSGKRIPNGHDFHIHHMHHHSLHHDSDEMSVSPMSSQMSCRPSDTPRSTSSHHAIDDVINDDLLMCLTVRELNKRLHGYPREDVVRLKQKRRTLKNRGYAQNCRSKRLHQRHELEVTNRTLQNEVHRLKMENSRICQERDTYKHRFDLLKKKFEFVTATSHNSNIPSPDVYERYQ